MLEKILTDMETSVAETRTSLEEYMKAIGNWKSKNWEADVRKAKLKVVVAVANGRIHLKALEAEMTNLAGTGAGRKEIADKLMRISNTQERLKQLLVKAEELIAEELVQAT